MGGLFSKKQQIVDKLVSINMTILPRSNDDDNTMDFKVVYTTNNNETKEQIIPQNLLNILTRDLLFVVIDKNFVCLNSAQLEQVKQYILNTYKDKCDLYFHELSKFTKLHLSIIKKHTDYLNQAPYEETYLIRRFISGSLMNKRDFSEDFKSIDLKQFDEIQIDVPIQTTSKDLLRDHVKKGLIPHQYSDIYIYKGLLDLLKRLPKTNKSITVFRGFRSDKPEQYKVGDKLYHPNITSTSLIPAISLRFAGQHCCLLKIKIPPKFPLLFVNDFFNYDFNFKEFEVTLHPCVLKITHIHKVTFEELKSFIDHAKIFDHLLPELPTHFLVMEVECELPNDLKIEGTKITIS